MKIKGIAKPRRNPNIRYINPSLPNFDMPEIKGERYNTTVPDTLDLAERAAFAVHGLTGSTDPDYDGELYWAVGFGWKPPAMYHDANDWVEAKFFSPSLLLRQACGSEEGLEVEWHRMVTLRQMQGPDGLLYIPLIGRPWGREFGGEGDMFNAGSADHMMPLGFQGRYASVAASYYWATGDKRWLDLAEGIMHGLRNLLIDKGDYAFFHKTIIVPGERKIDSSVPPPYINHACAWVGNGLMEYHRMTGSEQALEIAYKLARLFSLGHSGFVGPNGEFQAGHGVRTFESVRQQGAHFHANTHIRILMLNAGMARDDKEMIELARAGFQFGKDHGDTLMGYFPENVDADKIDPNGYGNTTEVCELSEMIYLALRQSTAGIVDCWDDVDRWMRNMFAESQLVGIDWAYAFSEKHGVPLKEDQSSKRARSVLDSAVTRNVPERVRGTWAGFVRPNDWQGAIPAIHNSIMHCCTGNMAMHFYRVWRDMVSYDEKKRRFAVHLLMNRAARQADVMSHIPYRGQVDVKVKQDCEIALRIPEWAVPQACAFSKNGATVQPAWDGRYANIGAQKGEVLSMQCPIVERKETRVIMSKPYRLVIRGNEIVDIAPPGVHCPIFKRSHYRQDDTRWKSAERFISDRILDNY